MREEVRGGRCVCSMESRNSLGNEGAERLFKQVQRGSCFLEAGVEVTRT